MAAGGSLAFFLHIFFIQNMRLRRIDESCKKIDNRSAKIGVIGLGYVGLLLLLSKKNEFVKRFFCHRF